MAHRWAKPTKRKQRIDPRYFLEETATRDEEILEEEDPESEADELLRLGGYDKTGKKMGKGTKTKRAGARRQASQEDPAGEDIEAVEAPQLERGVNR